MGGSASEVIEDYEETSIEGVVVPQGWDDATGNVILIGLSTPGEREFSIDTAIALGRDLLAFVGSKVRVQGLVGPRAQIIVHRYEVLDAFDGCVCSRFEEDRR
jgi:hypothetical protein